MIRSLYACAIETELTKESTRLLLNRFRPFRIKINFSNGFSTGQYNDETLYSSDEPLQKLHYFEKEIPLDKDIRILDVGCHLGYYGYYFLKNGAGHYTGIEINERIFDCAKVIHAISTKHYANMNFQLMDFSNQYDPRFDCMEQNYDAVLSLASANNALHLTSYFSNIARCLRNDGRLILEYLALDENMPTCEFKKNGYRGDDSLKWIFSQSFADDILESFGIINEKNLLYWKNEKALGEGTQKIISVYKRV